VTPEPVLRPAPQQSTLAEGPAVGAACAWGKLIGCTLTSKGRRGTEQMELPKSVYLSQRSDIYDFPSKKRKSVNFLLVLGVALCSTGYKMHLHGRSKFSARAWLGRFSLGRIEIGYYGKFVQQCNIMAITGGPSLRLHANLRIRTPETWV
jgi:hypothetical protein